MTGYDFLLEFLEKENIRHKESGNVIQFCLQGINYLSFKSDTDFLQISVLLKAKDELTKLQVLELCNDLNSEKFITKFVFSEKRVWCNLEFIPSPKTTTEAFHRALRILDNNSDEFLIRMNRL